MLNLGTGSRYASYSIQGNRMKSQAGLIIPQLQILMHLGRNDKFQSLVGIFTIKQIGQFSTKASPKNSFRNFIDSFLVHKLLFTYNENSVSLASLFMFFISFLTQIQPWLLDALKAPCDSSFCNNNQCKASTNNFGIIC